MLSILFGWRKASKCKKLIQRVQCRLKQLENRRYSILRQLREDIALLVKIGDEHIAFNKAGQLFQDEGMITVYGLLGKFCQVIISNLSYIRRQKDCPNDINEAVSTLIFASARCGDLPELLVIRKLFGGRYGQRFEMTALELLPGNLVNIQVKEKLSISSAPDDVKQKLVDEIARDYCLRPEILAIEYTSEWKQQAQEHGSSQLQDAYVQAYDGRIEGPQVEVSNASDTEGKAIHVVSASTTRSSPTLCRRQENLNMISASVSSFVFQQSPPNIRESLVHTPERKDERKGTASSSECLPQFADESIVYLDDVEELQSSIKDEESFQDQRIFKFKSPVLSKSEKVECVCDVKYMNENESWDEKSSSSSNSLKRNKKATRKKTRKSSVRAPQADSSEKDTDYMTYYGKNIHNKHRKKNQLGKGERLRGAEKRKKRSPCNHWLNKEVEIPSRNQNRGTIVVKDCYCSRTGEPKKQMQRSIAPERPRRRSCELGAIVHDLLANHQDVRSADMQLACIDDQYSPTVISPLTSRQKEPSFSRAMTMPQELSKDSCTNQVLQHAKSFPAQSPRHVHPKLPDYDDLAAKFMALKRVHQQQR